MATEMEITELRLGLPGGILEKKEKKRVHSEITTSDRNSSNNVNVNVNGDANNNISVRIRMKLWGGHRKVDLSTHKGYAELVMALEKLFDCYGIGDALEDADMSEYVPIYEDRDGDWMLVGDVPWQMFSESCKRLRIMKRSDAEVIGLGARDFLKGMSENK
ncbi:hypothetical protein RND71_017168 [Anisodus tanguticus]|uniref:Auxin-responsive protein n=1 Tax=Anisodus tanguticus TaxID=243964 RepID=A0AAE1VAR4_9SOLA|nr:hypothetical protein RND71_017168 [Anisodus tanguticus]